jgi:hypothetical protein
MRSPFGSLNIRHALDGMARQFRRNFGSQSPPSVAALREREMVSSSAWDLDHPNTSTQHQANLRVRVSVGESIALLIINFAM